MPEAGSELTPRQRAVIERIERRVPIKTIASELGISPTRVNQHVRAIKDHYGVNSLGELVDNFRAADDQAGEREDVGDEEDIAPFPKDAFTNQQVSPAAEGRETALRNDSAEFAFSDALSISIEAPWERETEPVVVPGVLDGRNFVTARLLAMVGGAVGIMSLLVLVLTSFLSLGEMLEGRAHVPGHNSALAGERGGVEEKDVRSGQSGRVENPKADARS
jgi:DNA-binding CsgD family transcriptional regulator